MRRLALGLALVSTLVITGCESSDRTAIRASGQIEAQEVTIAAELSGRVVDVAVAEGDSVKAGDLLLRLDDSLLLSEMKAAQAALDSASAGVHAAQAALDSSQAQYDLALSAALAAEAPQRRQTWQSAEPGEYAQPTWYFSKAEQLQSAQAEVAAALTAWHAAQTRLAEAQRQAGSAAFLEIEMRLSDARAALDVSKRVLDSTDGSPAASNLHDVAQTAYDDAIADLDDAQNAYDDALTTDGALHVLNARAEVEVAHERYYVALDALRALQTGQDSLLVVAAASAVNQAEAALAQAQSAADTAQANLDLIHAQMDRLSLRAPSDGVVLVRSIAVGEVIQAGFPALTLGQLATLKVTVYLPETQYGLVRLGQRAVLSVDSFPNYNFSAVVTRIADQAEFTPQNVQTQEGRQATVYGLDLTVDNSDGRLKPGMPADVLFEDLIAGG